MNFPQNHFVDFNCHRKEEQVGKKMFVTKQSTDRADVRVPVP